MATTHVNDDAPQTYTQLSPGAELLVDQTADLVMRTLPHIGAISVSEATYEYHLGFCRVDTHGEHREVPAHALVRIERDQTLKGGAGLLPVWTWRDKRRLVTALRADNGEPVQAVEVRYTDANDTVHVPTFRVDAASRQAFLGESVEVSSAIARRTVAMLKTMMLALDKSPLTSGANIRGDYSILKLRDADLRTEAVSAQLAKVDPDLPLDSRDPRRLTLGTEQLQRMLAFTEQVVFQESAVIAAAIRECFVEIQGKRPVGWRRWLPGQSIATYRDGTEEPIQVSAMAAASSGHSSIRSHSPRSAMTA